MGLVCGTVVGGCRIGCGGGQLGRAPHRPVPRRLLGAAARRSASRERAPLPGAGSGVPVSRHPYDTQDGWGDVARSQRGSRFRPRGIRAVRRPPTRPGRDATAPGFRTLARRHWRKGAAELAGDYSRRLVVRAARQLIPELTPADVEPGPAGIRAQALTPDGLLVDDFVVGSDGGVLHVRNTPSPGATSSLAIGETIADMAADAFQL